jgi:hypothetical protein
MVKHYKKAKLNIKHMTVNFLGIFFRTSKIFFGLTRSSCLSVRMTDNFSASFGKSDLKWTYFCNHRNFALRKLQSKYIISIIVSSFIARFVSMSAIANYFCQIYENVDIMFIEIYRIH